MLLLVQYKLCSQCTEQLSISPNCTVKTIGHRAYSHIFPENTLLAIEQAFKHGVKVCEVDVSLTKDGVYVLFHDSQALSRVTNSLGQINQTNYSDLQQLEVGAWKEVAFTGTPIPTLEQAMLVAEKYDGQLYLDTKDFSPEAMQQALQNTGVQPHRIVPSLESINSATSFRQLMPNTPWIWYYGGELPANVSDPNFYSQCVALGCQAFEVGWSEVLENPDYLTFEQQVHLAGSQVWAFTANDNTVVDSLIARGVDGVETDRSVSLAKRICGEGEYAFPDSLTTGNWRFKSSLLDRKGIGSRVRPFNYVNTDPTQLPSFNTCANFGISALDNATDSVMLVPAQNPTDGLMVYTGFSIDDDGTEDFTYTVLLDFLVPAASMGKWVGLYQTTITNSDDAELFINPQGKIGIVGDYFATITPNTWYRLAISYNGHNQILSLYLNGQKYGQVETFSNRWSLYNSGPSGENQGFRLLADNNNETADVYISAVQLRDYPIDSLEAALLGSPSAGGFPSHNADLILPTSALALNDSTLIDYDNQVYSMVFKTSANLSAIPLNFFPSSGATANISSGSSFDFSQGSIEIGVMSEDSTNFKTWTFCGTKASDVGIDNENTLAGLEMWPNPSRGMVQLKANSEIEQVECFNLTGIQVYDSKVSSKTVDVNLRNLSAGMYVVKVGLRNGETITRQLAVVE